MRFFYNISFIIAILALSVIAQTKKENENYNIEAPFILTAPNGFEIWQTGTNQNITWQVTGAVTSVKIEYSTDGGTTWSTVVSSTPAASQSYLWVVPNTPSQMARVRILDAFDNDSLDASDANFTITHLSLLNPGFNQNVQAGKNYTINWNASTDIANINLEYSTDNGNNWVNIVQNIAANTGTYMWSVDNGLASNAGRIRITNSAFNFINNISPQFNFYNTIVNLLSPNGSEVLQAGTTQNITWQNLGSAQNLRLEYSTDNGTSWNTIVASVTASSQSFNWMIPNTPTTNGLVRIVNVDDNDILDVSDNVFTITRLTLTTPTTLEQIQAGTNYNINWNSSTDISQVDIEYSTDNGINWVNIVTNVNAALGTYMWAIPSNVHTTQARVRIKNSSLNNISFTSPQFILKQLDLLSPVSGTKWYVNSVQTITWNSGSISDLRIDYSTNNGVTFNNLIVSTSAATGQYTFVVPNTPSNQVIVRLRDASNFSIQTFSAMFEIAKSGLFLTDRKSVV